MLRVEGKVWKVILDEREIDLPSENVIWHLQPREEVVTRGFRKGPNERRSMRGACEKVSPHLTFLPSAVMSSPDVACVVAQALNLDLPLSIASRSFWARYLDNHRHGM